MVVRMVWMESWAVVIISLCVLTTIGTILLCCICWEARKKSTHHFYILDENGLKNVTSSEVSNNNIIQIEGNQRVGNIFRHLRSSGSLKNNLTSKILSNTEKKKWNSERDLMQAMEIGDTFDHSVLCFEDNGNNDLVLNGSNQDKDEDLTSCVSDESKHTFYSTYMARSTSAAGTFSSALSGSDFHSCAD